MSNLSRRIDRYSKEISTSLDLPQVDVVKIIQKHVSRVPLEEREDIVQELTCTILEARPVNLRVLYAICKYTLADYWRRYKSRDLYEHPLDDITERQQGELLVGQMEFERLESVLDAMSLYNTLPNSIRDIVSKRIDGVIVQGVMDSSGITQIPESSRIQPGTALSAKERKELSRFCQKHPELLRS